MATDLQETPEVGEIVIATVKEITAHGAYVTLDEYGGMRGFLHVSEISTGWVRNIYRFVKVNQKIVLKVVRMSKTRGEIDLSLRQVSGDERKEKLIDLKKTDRAKTIIELIRSRMNLAEDELTKYIQAMENEFDSLYDALEEVVRKGTKVLNKLNLSPEFLGVLEEVAKEKIVIPSVDVKGTIEITTANPQGIEIIREALAAAQSVKTGGSEVSITYLGSPKYRISVTAENYKTAEKALDTALEKVREIIEKKRGKFSFNRD